MSTHYLRLPLLCLFASTTLALGCGEAGPEPSPVTSPPAGHCEALCNHLDAVNKELRCDKDDSGLGETFEVNVESCISDCDKPQTCTDLRVIYNQCRIDKEAEAFKCNTFGGTPPTVTGQNCRAEFDVTIDCALDNR